MSYINSNKKAWEEAFKNRSGSYAEDLVSKLLNENDPYLKEPMIHFLNQHDLKDKIIAQFCCNNGRELLSISKRGIKHGYGFDIASNMIEYGNLVSKKLKYPVTFINQNILDIDASFFDAFDYLFITIGALCWFKDLDSFFKIASDTLKKGGFMVIHEIHPVVNMLATKDEESYDKDHESNLVYDYFKKTPWETGSMGYMTEDVKNKEIFYSFTHPLSDIMNAMIQNGFMIKSFDEYDLCIGNLVPHLDKKGIPLSYFLVAKKG